ncbi:succinate-semialdehyde dehydrogenase [bacterium BMS3Abin05]|nr:succinate-semialdehyde dehydrogenase [bacterium BMS3Abin05]GBE28202.1 succinate-semialdehyde dehydrogenase [bacterium BMS3Bbin03]
MSNLTQEQIDQIAKRVIGLIQNQPDNRALSQPYAGTASAASASLGNGIFPNIDSAVEAAGRAHLQLMKMSLETRNKIISNIRRRMTENAETLARKANEETGLGRVEDKILKNRLVIEKTPGTEVLKPTAFSGDRGLTLMELAPYGVIGSITPVTNPTSSIICNTIGMVAAGNGVVFNVHPGAKNVSIENIRLLNDAITEAGGPPNLVTTILNPTVESAQELMHHPGVRLLVVTGGSGVVKAAMASGKRAICAGPGNPPVVVDESADIDQAAKHIVLGASMDNNIICVDEKEVFVVSKVADQLIAALQRHGAVLLSKGQFIQLEREIFSSPLEPRRRAAVNKALIGKDVQVILSKIGLKVGKDVRLAVVELEEDHPLVWTEQMMPVFPVVRVSNADKAIDLAKEAEHGYGHTAVMHSKNLDNLSRMAKEMNCSIFVKNGPSVAGLGYGGEGYCSFSIASPTGEGLTNPRSFSRERRCVLVDHFRIV